MTAQTPTAGTAARTRLRRGLVATVAVATTTLVSGCGLTIDQIPLPKPGVGDSYELHAVFANALNLPDQAKVRVGGSDVGVVTGISTSNFQANIDMKIRNDIQLPTGTTAELRQATPLGDVFVAMSMPPRKAGDQLLQDGDTIPIDQTSAGAWVEQLLLSVTALINGGAINQLARITTELDSTIGGRGPLLSHLIVELTGVVSSLNQNTDRIDGVLREFDTTLATLSQRRDELGQLADALPPMISTISENNQNIAGLLSKVSTASAALGDFAKTTGPQLSGLLDSTDRLMTGLGQARDTLGPALEAVETIKPKVNASMEGTALTQASTLRYLSIGALHDPEGQQLPDLRTLNDMTYSIVQVLQRAYSRITGQAPPPIQPGEGGTR